MRWQFSARLTSLIVLAAVSLAVGGATLGLALARGQAAGTAEEAAAQVDKARRDTMSKADSRMFKRMEGKGDADRYKQDERKRDTDRYKRGKDGRDRYHDWRGSRRVAVVPRLEALRRSFFNGDSPAMRRFERVLPERQALRPGGVVIAVGEVTAVHADAIEMFTVLGNHVTIDVSQLAADVVPKVGASAVVIAERDGDRYVAQSLDLLNMRLSDMLEGMRAPARSGR